MADRPLSTVGDWDDMCARFQWRVPDDFNIAAACCDVWANAEPDRLALIEQRGDGIRNWTFGQLRDASDRFANVLSADGVGQGDRVAILLPQTPEVLITHFAAMKLGAVTVPLFSLFGPDALHFRLSDSGAKAIITNAEGAAKLTGLDLPGLSRIYVTDQPISPARDFLGTLNNAPATPRPPVAGAADPAMIIYTSGTTGPPKGALHAHRFLLGRLC
ncbi:MAG: AMP-binding protein [Rhodobacteraceae bacterium]|nr:AMP-binding protein [Paracoccaceae bacterium]